MKTKLTLSIDQDLIQFAHQQARSQGGSVSALVSDFLRSRKVAAEKQAVPSLDQMAGSLKHYVIDDSKEGIRAAYAQKHTR